MSLGEAVIETGADTSGFKSATEKAVGESVSSAERTLNGAASKKMPGIGRRMMGAAGKAMKATAVVSGAAVATVLGTSIAKGFSRLQSIDQATAKLEGLGHSAKAVEGIMDDAMKSVKGTAYGFGDAASIAAGMVASGIKPGTELEKVLGSVGDAASIAGVDLGDMGNIFGKVAAQNKLTGESLTQLTEKGIPVLQWLADEYDITAEAAQKMVSDGKVDFATFQKVIDNNIGGAAKKAGDTFKGAMDNMQAAMGRFGAEILGGVFSQLPGVFSGINDWFDKITPAGTAMGEMAGGVLASGVERFKDMAAAAREPLSNLWSWLREKIWPAINDDLIPALSHLHDSVSTTLVPAMEAAVEAVKPLVTWLLENLIPAFSAVVDFGADVIDFFGEHDSALNVLKGTVAVVSAFIVAKWGVTAARAVASAFQQVVAWFTTAAAAKTSEGAQKKSAAQVVAGWIIMAAKAMWNALKVAAAWVIGIIKPAAAAVASMAKTAAVFVAKWVLMGIQSLIGAAKVAAAWLIAMGPVAIVIAVVVGLGILIYKNWDKIKKWTRKAWDAIVKAISGVWDTIKKWSKKALDFLVKIFLNFTGPGLIIKHWDTIKERTAAAWDWVRTKTKEVWDKIAGALSNVLGGIRGTFKRVVDKIKTIWDGIKEMAAKPVNFVIDTIYNNGLREMINKIPGIKKLDKVSKVGGYRDGGPVRGPGTGTSDSILARLSAGEFVVREAVASKIRPWLEAANAGKWLPKFAAGGTVWPASGQVTRHPFVQYPWAKWSGDINVPGDETGNPVRAYRAGLVADTQRWNHSYGHHIRLNHPEANERTLYAHLSSILVGIGERVSAGQLIGRVGNTGNSSGPHLHFEIMGGAGRVGGRGGSPDQDGDGIIGGITSLIKKGREVWKAIRGMGNDGWWSVMKDAAGSLGASVRDWINDKIPGPGPIPTSLFDTGGILPHGTLGMNTSGKPERVLSPRQTASFESLVKALEGRQADAGSSSKRLILRVGGRDFVAYLEEIADSRIEASESLEWQGA